MQEFRSSIIITIIGLVLGYMIGGWETLYIVALLAILEVSLSFDNAVVNVKVLEEMEPKWQQRFITFGIPVAVFGMRFLFPILVVAIASGTGLFETFHLAMNDASAYKQKLLDSDSLIYAFGGSFLLMVFLSFLFDKEKEEHWLESIEDNEVVRQLGKVDSIQMLISMSIGLTLVAVTTNYKIALAYFTGLILYSIIASMDKIFNVNGIRNGLMGFIYLEVLDASFSFDGVIGAFALSSDIFVIMLGLGIGAMFVRSLTLYMLKKKTLAEYRYLEHGAHYAILILAIIMIVKIFTPVNELFVGTVGVFFIGISTYHSILANRKP